MSSANSLSYVSGSRSELSRANDDDSQHGPGVSQRGRLLIVAVHGLAGKDFDTWSPKSAPPLSSLLSTMVYRGSDYAVDVNTMDFQYEVRDVFTRTNGITGFRKLAFDLLEEVYTKRGDHFVPIVFLAHDMGGILVKEALLLARFYARYRSIALDTETLILFATPQQCDDSWNRLFLKLLFAMPDIPLRDDLLNLSWIDTAATSGDISNRFRTVATEYRTLSVYQETPSDNDSDDQLVFSEMEVTCKMPKEKTLSRKRDHFDICQFTGEDDQLKILVEQIRGSLSTGPFDYLRGDYLRLLNNLSPKFMAGFEMEWSTMTKKSFEWILDNKAYKSWSTSSSPAILHLRGVKGAGKTVISHFLVETLREREGARGAAVASFFFSKDDDRFNKVHSLCVSLAAQLLITKPTLFRGVFELFPTFLPLVQETEVDEHHAWILLRTILCCAGTHNVICIINAIHEADSEMKDFLTNLMSVKGATEAPFRVIVTSTFDDYREILQPCHELALDDEENMQFQVMSSIKESVANLVQQRQALRAFETEITTQICNAKPLNLLDAELSLNYLKEARIHSTPTSLRSALAQLSESSPQMALRRLVENATPWTIKILSWMTYALRPLRLGELTTAMAMTDLEKSSDPVDDFLARDIEADIRQTLGSVIRVQNNEVQFVHPSIKEAVRHYIQKEGTAVSHRTIALTCLSYLSSARLQDADTILKGLYADLETTLSDSDSFSKDYGLVLYAVQYWPAHYRNISMPSEKETDQVCRFLDREDWVRSWSDIDRSTQRPVLNIPPFTSGSPARLGAYLGFEDVVKSQFDGISAEMREELLTIAAANDRLQVTKFLLDHPYEPAAISAALNEALSHRSKSVISVYQKVLSQEPQIPDIDISLERAAAMGHEELFKSILHSKLRQQITRTHMVKALCAAAAFGSENIVRELLDSKCLSQIKNEDLAGEPSLQPLHGAVLSGHEEVVRLLTQHLEPENQQANQQDERGMTPLHLACMLGFPEMVTLLTPKAASPGHINTPDKFGHTPLHYAASYGHGMTIEALASLKADLDLEAKTRRGRTALCLAVLEHQQTIVDQFLRLEANPNISDKHGETPLHAAVSADSLEMVEALVNYKAKVNERTSAGFTPLLVAVQLGSLEIFELLRNHEAELTTQDDEGLTPLHWASKNGHADLVCRILELGADPNATDKSDFRPIHHAAKSGHIRSLKHLIEKGAEIESKTPREKTALHLAAEHGNGDCVALLLSKGANTNQPDWTGQIPLESATEAGYHKIAALLLSKHTGEQPIDGAVLEKLLHQAALDGHYDFVKELLKTNVNLGSKDSDGDSLIINAVYGASVEVITALLETPGFDVNGFRTDGTGPLQVAVMNSRRDIVELLLRYEADVNKSQGRAGTALHVAALYGDVDLIKVLLERKADVNGLGGNLETPLQTAASSNRSVDAVEVLIDRGGDVKAMGGKWGNILNAAVAAAGELYQDSSRKMLELLFEHGASIQDEDQQGRSAIHMTGYSGNVEMLKEFLKQDESGLVRRDKQGRTVLHFAAAQNGTEMVSYILGSSEDVDAPHWLDRDLWTPLHWACRRNNTDTVRLLLERGFDVSAKTSNGWSAIHVATFHNSQKILDLLKGKKGKVSDDRPEENEPKRDSEQDGNSDEEDDETDKNEGDTSEEEQNQTGRESEHSTIKSEDDSDAEDKNARLLFSFEGLPLKDASSITYSCDGCYCKIYGPIYHCLTCINYDFCFKCAWTRDETHPGHQFEIKYFKEEDPPRNLQGKRS